MENRLHVVEGGLDQLMGRVQAIVNRAESTSSSLRWKTLGHPGLLAAGALMVVLPLLLWWEAGRWQPLLESKAGAVYAVVQGY